MPPTPSYPSNRRRFADHRATTPTRPSPLRYASTIPTTPDEDEPPASQPSKPYGGLVSTPTPSARLTAQQSQRRRISLGELQQAPNAKSTPPPQEPQKQDPETKEPMSVGISRANLRDVPSFGNSSPYTGSPSRIPVPSLLDSADLEKLGRSATRELRTLSKLAEQGGGKDDFTMTGLQRNLSKKIKKPGSVPGYGGKTWMDTERQYRHAYEYLCHIGEAKEWIEHVIDRPISPIVQLEETLRDGVTLAEVVQAFRPNKRLRIFRHPRLQFRHSDNIVLFFQFLAEVELPELFRFELVDLYEKKNIPKVIYCIHALSWLLLGKNMVNFRIGNLVGRLNFEDHELESTQKNLDKAGISMPNFSGMGERFGAASEPLPEPEPEPVETESERIDRELAYYDSIVLDLQAQVRGALVRIRLGNTVLGLYQEEPSLVDLQSRIRATLTRQTTAYQLERHQFAAQLQARARGFTLRTRLQRQRDHWKNNEWQIIILQSLMRARAARKDANARKASTQHYWKVHTPEVIRVQNLVRGRRARKGVDAMRSERAAFYDAHKQDVVMIQSLVRRRAAIKKLESLKAAWQAYWLRNEPEVITVQNLVRKRLAKTKLQDLRQQRNAYYAARLPQIVIAQSAVRRKAALEKTRLLKTILHGHEDDFVEVQAAIRGALVRRRILEQLDAFELVENNVIDLQSTIRRKLLQDRSRRDIATIDAHASALVDLQSQIRAMLLRTAVGDQLEALQEHEEETTDLQAAIRGFLVRKTFAEKQRHYQENIQKIIKIQSLTRMKQQGQAYKSLTMGKNPPVSTIKNFVHLLNDSDFDFDQELESEKVQQNVIQQIKKVEEVEDFIAEIDVKIGLLAHTKIQSDETAKLKRQLNANFAGLSRKSTSARDTGASVNLNRDSRAKIEKYQELFSLLQTQPQYLARLFRRFRENGATEVEFKRLESLVLSTFAFAQKRREEFYLLKLLTRSLKEDVDACPSMQDFVRGNFIFSKIFALYTRVPRDRKYIQQVLRATIKTQLVDNEQIDLESDPSQIYKTILDNEYLRTGRYSRDQNLPREAAIREEDVRRIFVSHLQDIRDLVDNILVTMKEKVNSMPYGTRYMAQQMFELLQHRFPREHEADILSVVGQWLWKTYFKPALIDPEGYGLVDTGLDEMHRRNISTLASVLNQIASGRLFDQENVYLQPLNRYLEEHAMPELENVWSSVLNIEDIESTFEIGQLDDFYAKSKPTLFIKVSDMIALHILVVSEVHSLCTAPEDDVLREVIRELGNPKVNESEFHGGPQELVLTLGGKMHALEDPDAKAKTLLIETKRCILYIIRVQTGATLLEIMVKPITPDDLSRWNSLVAEELSLSSSKTTPLNTNHRRNPHAAYCDTLHAPNLLDIASLSYSELKRTALENILALESQGKLTRANGYQDILNAIALDIRSKHRRRLQRAKELETARTTSHHLAQKQTYLEARLKAYNDTFHQSLSTLQHKSAEAQRNRFLVPFSKQWHHERSLARRGVEPRFGSWRRSGEHMKEKGVLVSWEGRDLARDDVTVSSDVVNEFVIEGSRGSLMIPGAVGGFSWDDLLGAEYEGREVVEFFGSVGGGFGYDGSNGKGSKQVVQGVRGGGAYGGGGTAFGGECGVLRLNRAALMLWLSKRFLGSV